MSERPWLAFYSWDVVTYLNQQLCLNKNAAHGPTSDGHEATKAMWLEAHKKPMPLLDALILCRNAHKSAPFLFYNGNTFVAVIRQAMRKGLDHLSHAQAAALSSQGGHYVAGVLDMDSLKSTLEELRLLGPSDATAS